MRAHRLPSRPHVVVIGAGIGGLTAAAVLARSGLEVTVLEAHVYAGGCAGTFLHKGYRFDAGATLAGGFYAGGPMDKVARATGIESWPARAAEPAMAVRLPSGLDMTRWVDGERRRDEVRRFFGAHGEHFFAWQERTADALWELAMRQPPWPPQRAREAFSVAGHGLSWLLADPRRLDPRLAADALRPVAAHLGGAPQELRQFVDGQLLIAAQATSRHANALYGAAALDLPRRGVVHLEGGMGAIARTLVEAVRTSGGRVRFRQEVTRIVLEDGRPVAVETRRGDSIAADLVVANLTPWNIARLLGDSAPRALRQLPLQPASGGGAFMLYVGLDADVVPTGRPLHHQVIVREPLREGNSVFLSLSPEWDGTRAPPGQRALTISTHTDLAPWWQLRQYDVERYQQRKDDYAQRLLDAAEQVLPGLRDAARLVLPGTPVTFERFTRRAWGWVGGFPQTGLLQAWGPRIASGLWMVGDSIFPGQSTAAAALGGLRVASAVLADAGAAKAKDAPLADKRWLPEHSGTR